MALDHVVIVGGSYAGAMSAGVLAEHFERVTIVERDDLPATPEYRKGVPQSPHVHGILKLGRDMFNKVYPGFTDETVEEGAVLFDLLQWMGTGMSSPNVLGYAVRRPLLEHVARRRALALPNVELVRGRAEGLAADNGRVTGLVVADPEGDGTRVLEADLVIDGSGRSGASSKWLEATGFDSPEETIVNAFGGYASRLLRVPEDAWPGEQRFSASLPSPANTKGYIFYPQDNGLHIMSLFGQSRDYPPGDEEEFAAFMAQCVNPTILEVLEKAEVITDIQTSRSTANRWRHFERIAEPPAGFVAVGDAFACFNPMNGQGTSTACMGAVLLGETLVDVDGDMDRLPAEFHSRLAVRSEFPWQVAIGYDFQFPETSGDRSLVSAEMTELNKWLAVCRRASFSDLEIFEAVSLVPQTFDPSLVYQPHIVEKVEAWRAAQPEGSEPDVPVVQTPSYG